LAELPLSCDALVLTPAELERRLNDAPAWQRSSGATCAGCSNAVMAALTLPWEPSFSLR
jgi:hypothetical protein